MRSTRPAASNSLRLWPLAAALLLAACAGGQTVSGPPTAEGSPPADARAANALPISDLPVPAGSRLEADSSLIMGTQDKWLGRLVLKADMSPTQAYNHFSAAMGGFGWQPVTAVQGRLSSLTFLRGERVATVLIEPAGLGGGVTISVTVSPRQSPAPAQDAPRR